MKIIYNNVDIYKDISLNYAVHEMHAENEADSLVLRFNDSKGLWSKWDPKTGDTIALEQKKSVTGKMFIHELTARNGIYTIRAMSMPMTMKDRRSASWQRVTLEQIAREIATRHGLTLKTFGIQNQIYSNLTQTNESDTFFLSTLCRLEGYQMIVFDGSIIIYDEAEQEKTIAGDTVEIGASSEYTCEDRSSEAYGTSKVYAGTYQGQFSAGSGKRTMETLLKANSNTEATRFAKGLLRNANKALKTGCVLLDFTEKYAPASVIEVIAKKAVQWTGKSFVTKVRQDYVQNTTRLYFRGIYLEGY